METQIKNLKKGDKFKWKANMLSKYPNGVIGEVIDFEDLPERERRKWAGWNDIWFRSADWEYEYDGLVPEEMVELISSPVASQNEPKNNDGRAACFWCPKTNTQKRGNGAYDVCPKCGR